MWFENVIAWPSRELRRQGARGDSVGARRTKGYGRNGIHRHMRFTVAPPGHVYRLAGKRVAALCCVPEYKNWLAATVARRAFDLGWGAGTVPGIVLAGALMAGFPFW